MKTTKRDVLDDLAQVITELHAKSDDYLRMCKSYHCRSNAEIRAGLVKGAGVMRMDANKIQAVIDKHRDQPNVRTKAVAEVFGGGETPDRHVATEAEPADQDAGHVDLSDMQEGDGHA